MFETLHIQHDWTTVLAFLFGAAVIVPSMLSLFITLATVAGNVF
jgi:hypothetical protein